jgi:two-component system, cell cycle response regulator
MNCLILSQDPVVSFMVEQAAAHVGCETRTVSAPEDALASATDGSGIQFVVVDHALPRFDGAAWCGALRQTDTKRSIRVLLLTPADDPFDLRRLADLGIDDILVKPALAVELEARFLASLRIVELEAQMEAANRALKAVTTYDPLTSVLNEEAINDALYRECDRCRRERTPLASVVVTVDDLATIREWDGVGAADAMLVEVAARIRVALRPYDNLGRYGEAGFLVGLPRCNAEGAVSAAQRILASLDATPMKCLGHVVSISASLGVAALTPTAASDYVGIVSNAAAAAEQSRSQGGRCVVTLPETPGA